MCVCVCRGVCTKYLTDEHASCHGEPGAGGEVWSDHDSQASVGEGELVGVEDEELVHHDDWRRLLPGGLTCRRRCGDHCGSVLDTAETITLFLSVLTFVEEHHGGVAGGGILCRLVVSVVVRAGPARPGAAQPPRGERHDLGVEPANSQDAVCFHSEAACSEQRVSAVSRQFDLLINVLHDDDVDAVHGHEEQGLPPAQREACLCWSLRERLLQHTEETDISSLETPVIN